MEGVTFLLSIVIVGIIIFWSWKNDHVPIDGKTSGILAMRDPEPNSGANEKGESPDDEGGDGGADTTIPPGQTRGDSTRPFNGRVRL